MGQKINPIAFRTGTFLPWRSRWFADDIKFKEYLFEDIQIRKALMEKLKLAGVSGVEINNSNRVPPGSSNRPRRVRDRRG